MFSSPDGFAKTSRRRTNRGEDDRYRPRYPASRPRASVSFDGESVTPRCGPDAGEGAIVRQATKSPETAGVRRRSWRLWSRFAAASVVATSISQLVFVLSYAIGALPAVATVLAWLAGAIPNFLLNRRTWGGGGRAALRREILRYAVISVTTALLAAFATSGAETLATTTFPGLRTAQVAVVWSAFIGTYMAMFVVKFFLVDRLVFNTDPRRATRRSAGSGR
jgi:putative flippase GtrA